MIDCGLAKWPMNRTSRDSSCRTRKMKGRSAMNGALPRRRSMAAAVAEAASLPSSLTCINDDWIIWLTNTCWLLSCEKSAWPSLNMRPMDIALRWSFRSRSDFIVNFGILIVMLVAFGDAGSGAGKLASTCWRLDCNSRRPSILLGRMMNMLSLPPCYYRANKVWFDCMQFSKISALQGNFCTTILK